MKVMGAGRTRQVVISAVVAVLCAGILALFTDVEISVVEWINCGPLAPEVERRSEACRNRR